MSLKKYVSLERLTEYTRLLNNQLSENDADVRSYIDESIEKMTDGTTSVKEAEHSGTSDNATKAETADEATHAISADSATKATQDAAGNIITETYETKTDATAKLTEAKEYTDEAIMNSQADFAVTDETSPSFIKNKPTEEDAMELLAEMNIIQPMADESGALYVDENNTIYVI